MEKNSINKRRYCFTENIDNLLNTYYSILHESGLSSLDYRQTNDCWYWCKVLTDFYQFV